MRLVFDAGGRFTSQYSVVGNTNDAPPDGYTTKDFRDWPEAYARGIWRAAVRGRVTYKDKQVMLDGAPLVAPAAAASVMTYTDVRQDIAAAKSVDELKKVIYLIADELMRSGALDL
jgi:hypothetical protein